MKKILLGILFCALSITGYAQREYVYLDGNIIDMIEDPYWTEDLDFEWEPPVVPDWNDPNFWANSLEESLKEEEDWNSVGIGEYIYKWEDPDLDIDSITYTKVGILIDNLDFSFEVVDEWIEEDICWQNDHSRKYSVYEGHKGEIASIVCEDIQAGGLEINASFLLYEDPENIQITEDYPEWLSHPTKERSINIRREGTVASGAGYYVRYIITIAYFSHAQLVPIKLLDKVYLHMLDSIMLEYK